MLVVGSNETYGWSQDVETRSSIGKTVAQSGEDYKEDFNLHWAYSIEIQRLQNLYTRRGRTKLVCVESLQEP